MGKRRILIAKGPQQGVRTTRVVMPRELQAGQLRMVFYEAGLGAPVVMVHGLGGSARWWFPLFPELTSSHMRLIAPDLPGFGRSRGRMLKVREAARAIIQLADQAELAEFYLCGHSMGGAIALQVAADFGGRVRRLVLIDSAGIPGVGSGRVLSRLLQPWSWCPMHFYSTFLKDVLRAGPRAMLAGAHHLSRYDVRPVLKRVRQPTLVVWGGKDRLTPLEHGRRIATALRDARMEVIPKARHLPMVSHPGEVSGLIKSFFREDEHAG